MFAPHASFALVKHEVDDREITGHAALAPDLAVEIPALSNTTTDTDMEDRILRYPDACSRLVRTVDLDGHPVGPS